MKKLYLFVFMSLFYVSTSKGQNLVITGVYDGNLFTLHPNPLRGGLLNVKSESHTAKNISIFDIIGKQVYLKKTTESQINISNLKAGLYFVKVQQDGKIATRKLVVE